MRDAGIGEVSAILTTASHKRVMLDRRRGVHNLTMPSAIECWRLASDDWPVLRR